MDQIPDCWISRNLSEKTRQKAEAELNESDERKAQAITELRQKIGEYSTENPTLKLPQSDDDAFLVRFLRARKYDVDRALKLIVSYATFRATHTELFEGVTLEKIRPILEHKLPFVLRERDEEGRRVLLFQPARMDPNLFNPMDVQTAFVYVLDGLIQDEETQVNGFIMVEDYTDMTMMKMMMFDQKLIKQMADLVQEAFPARFKGFHMVNQPWFFSIAWKIAKPFLKEKMRSRIHMHGTDMNSLHEALGKEGLPAEVGGERPAYDPAELIEFLRLANVQRPPAKPESSSV
ncbi:retinaldehyde-binding protein 1-like [Sycon ciliatum]|uniref:retinaldehyde-binding protein 1-like n=1 Tax=Sycon ciliatum TaxID=27933 RepID=UPI0020AA6BA8|eukprot:scpid66874/ scgid34001/ Retinaldehyde-binding protein 1; Cellular retinaldehyde-binding protein